MFCKSTGASIRSSPPKMILEKGVLEICSKVTGERPWKASLSKPHFDLGVLL